tara:strand:+ start:7166 stop:7393 length:228 start_codon:yes stop_codon:yes gene_type:complete
MAKITNKKIKEFIFEKYDAHIEYDGVKIERNIDGYDIDVKIISFGRKICWFQGDNYNFFESMETQINWQLCISAT